MDIGIGMGLTVQPLSQISASYVNPEHTKLLLHFDSDFKDSSFYNNVETLINAPVIDTVAKVFGTGSMSFNQAQAVSFPASDFWKIADGIPWQLSFRAMRSNASVTAGFLFATHVWNGAGWSLRSDGFTTLKLQSNGADRASWNYTFPLDIWTIHRVNYDGFGNYRWYVDGVLLGVETPTGMLDGTLPLHIGNRIGQADGFEGKFDEVLWEKHPDLFVTTNLTYAVETAPYSFPTKLIPSPINPASYGKLLLHLDSGFSDSSNSNSTPLLRGSPVIDSGQSIFGGASLKKLAGEALEYPVSGGWEIADGVPWQVSFRLYRVASHQYAAFLFGNHNWGTSGFHLRIEGTQLKITSNGADRALWTHTIPLETWEAHRVNYDGAGRYRWYVDGLLLGIREPTGISDSTSSALAVGNRVGSGSQADGWPGYMDEILWEKHADLVIATSTAYVLESTAFPDS